METVTQAIEEATSQILALGTTFFAIGIAISIVPYFLFAIGLNSVAKACRLRNSWMAWVPIARKHLLAEVADIRRIQVGKPKKLATQFEICTFATLMCLLGLLKASNPIILVIPAFAAAVLSFNQTFSYYYFYRLCDKENATAYFLLGLIARPLNAFFVYHCR